ncbi:MAG: NAD-dependent epimerase/dehydratase family protein [Gemmatimonadaceae bacterium]
MQTRRDFLKTTAAAAGALSAGMAPRASSAAPTIRDQQSTSRATPAPLKILILGGTGFIGPFQVRYAVERGHHVTVFNRGKHQADLPDSVEHLSGDRSVDDYASLAGRRWDAVIDNSATDPKWVRGAGAVLKNSVGHYLFVSTRSVYSDTSRIPMDATAPVFTPETTKNYDPTKPLPYGLSKALAEKETLAAFGAHATIVRPSLIIGPTDDTDRFTYWPVRLERGGEVLAPGDPSDPVQVIDVRDVSEWIVRLSEQRDAGIFNALGPHIPRRFDELLYGIHSTMTSGMTLTWVPAAFLKTENVREYSDMPVWRDPHNGAEGFARFDVTKELAKGLTYRPLAVTAKDTLDWWHSLPPERRAAPKTGLSAEREREVLAKWRGSNK